MVFDTIKWALAAGAFLAAGSGCSSYAVPGKGADMRAMKMSADDRDRASDPSVVAAMDRKPLAQFPATIAVVRIQGSKYEGRTIEMYGEGSYRVALTRDVEKPEQIAKLASMPMVRALEPMNRLLLPERLNSQEDLRAAAAVLHADMLLIYTFDDTFEDRDDATPVTVLSIGLIPTKWLTVRSDASAVLIDTRNGFVYGAAAGSKQKSTLSNCWGETAAADAVREEVETAAFVALVDNMTVTWGQVVGEYGPGQKH